MASAGSNTSLRQRPWLGLAVATASCFAAFAVRRLLDSVFPPGFPFVSFFPAVIITAYFAGRSAGLVCTVLCAMTAWYFFLPPYESFAIDLGTGLALVFFLCVASYIALLIGHMQIVTDRLDTERARSARLYEQERVLFQELQHRVANNMQFVASLLHLQKRQLEIDPGAAIRTVEDASRRIETMARVHRRLYDASAVDVPIEQYLREICNDVVAASPAGDVKCNVAAAPIRLDVERLMIVSLITTEVITNCLKHAFAQQTGGTIDLNLVLLDPTTLELTIRDDGCGLPPGYDRAREGLGTRILKGLAAQLQGRLTMSSDRGTVTRLRFPASKPQPSTSSNTSGGAAGG